MKNALLIINYIIFSWNRKRKGARAMAYEALYYQIEYGDYSKTICLEAIYATEDEIAMSVLYQVTQSKII